MKSDSFISRTIVTIAFKRNPAAMLFDKFITEDQPQPGAFLVIGTRG
jgi:hypothetical protein